MTERNKMFKRIISMLVCAALLLSYLPSVTVKTAAADQVTGSASIVSDAGTAHTWETMMGTATSGNRYAGRVWADKSVFTNGQTALLDTSGAAGSSFKVELEDDEAFQVIFSALGSSMTSTVSNTYVGAMDVVLVMDDSVSMADNNRLRSTLTAANALLEDLLKIPDIRIAIVTYSAESEVMLPLNTYTNGIVLSANSYSSGTNNGVITAKDKSGRQLGKNGGYGYATYLQAGIDAGMQVLANAEDTAGRVPVAIVLTDGEANQAVKSQWYNVANQSGNNVISTYPNTTAGVVLSTLLTAAYGRACVERNYGRAPVVYGVGTDLKSGSIAHAMMDPATGFHNGSGANSTAKDAYNAYLKWANGETVTLGSGSSAFSLGQLPSNSAVTRADVIRHINYIDTYYDVASSDLGVTFTQIYEELSSGVFNPITSTQVVVGGSGVQNTPLVYVDHIGQHMQIKRIQSITLFGASYAVTRNADGTYTVAAATGSNPTTNERYNTAEDIRISVTENADGTQTLRIEIDQEVLPIILEQVKAETINGNTSAVINELIYHPLRVFYTIGLDSDIFLPSGEIDVTKIDDDYAHIDDATGRITFYSNAFNKVNTGDSNNNSYVDLGDAHIGFKPSAANRYYYYQENVGIFSSVTAKNGATINWEESEYGVLYEKDKYNITFLSYADYKNLRDNDTVYNYVTYYRPTPSQTDAANAAEEVSYIVYSQWKYMKESAAFYDRNADTYINYDAANGYVTGAKGYAIDVDKVAATISAYQAANRNADIIVVLGVGSHRSSRLHNMTVEKTTNTTGTAEQRYAPEYTYETAELHSGNDVVVWLGNNGKLTTTIATGIALTKAVTEAIGNADDTYPLTVTIPAGVNATPVVKNDNGQDVTAAISTYAGNVLTVNLKAGQTVYISGIPVGTQCTIGEVINGDYYVVSKTDRVTIPTLSQVLDGTAQYVPATVTNAPHKYGNLYITKDISSEHAIPDSIMQQNFALRVHVGTALAGNTYTIKLGNVNDPSAETQTTATVDANGNLNLTIRAQQTIEIIRLPEGTQVTITEVLTAEQQKMFAATYRTRNYSGDTADSDNQLTIPADANATAVITNQYTPVATTVQLNIAGTKHFQAESGAALNGGSFTFKLQRWNGTAWEDMTSAQTVYPAGESGTKTFLMENVLAGIRYEQAGTWAYQVVEVKGSMPNLTYDRTLYTFTVTVTDNGGQLVATVTDMNNTPITDGSYEVTFTNTYHTAPVSIDVIKDVVNTSGDNSVSKAGFAFTAVQTDANWAPLANGATLTVYTDAAGEARFTATYEKAGVYYYLVSEVNTGLPGWTYSAVQYRVTVTVTEQDGNLTSAMTIVAVNAAATGEQASVSGNKGTVSFVNTYDPADVTVDLNAAVKKELTGKELTAGAFTFKVYENGKTVTVLTGTNDAAGNVTFDQKLSFQQVGSYAYDVVEVIPDGAVYDAATGKYTLHGMTYDATIYDLVVVVTNNAATGKLEATYYFEDATTNTVTFRNTYTVTPTSHTFSGTKILNGRAMSAGEFSFWLYEGNTPVEKVTNKSDGSFSFSTITYTSAGTYVYTIREEAGNTPGVTYTGANNPITVTVTVTDTNGILSAVASVSNENIRFENTYTAKPASVTFDGVKNMVGAALADQSFTFKLYQTDSSFSLTDATLVDTVKNVSGRYGFDTIYFNSTGIYFYAIVEDATVDPKSDVVYDATVHLFRVRVSDVGDGQLRVEVMNVNQGTTTQAAASATISTSFTNATFQEVAKKEVFLAGSTTTHIDGQKVNAGDILEYFITYTNYTGKDVVVDIMDTIPANTSFVEGSASHGGTYVGTHVNWVLNVARGESVKVSFRVKVDKTDSVVANTAVVRDGVNVYTTNQVTNHTYEDVTEKDVFLADDLTTSIQGSLVALGDILTYTIRFTNTTAQAVSAIITDRIPANTSYVAGSATLGGVYADGMLTWTLSEVAAWTTVTVSFQVKVTATEHVHIQNQANVQVGDNHYTTNVVTNEHIPETTGFTVNKVWNDANNQDGIRPENVTIHIYGNGNLVKSVVLNAENAWTCTLTELDKYENGALIVYTVAEATVTGYTSVVTGDLSNGFTVTNTHAVQKTHISASKVWDDEDNQDGKRPNSVTVHLLANGEHTGDTAVLSAANNWNYTWSDLDQFRNGTEIVYTVFEELVEGYTAGYLRDPDDQTHVIITNTYAPEQTGLVVQKVWQDSDNQDGLRPASVQVELYADGVATGTKVALTAANNWRYSFTGLDRYADGKEIVYTVLELTQVAGYEVSYRIDSHTGLYEVINTHQPAKTQVSVNKVWDDAGNQDGLRPGFIQVELYANGVATGKKLTLNAANNWNAVFADLDCYASGVAVVYTIAEVEVPAGYTVAITGNATNGFTVTNSHVVEKTSITVNKVWNDANNQDGKRPASITVYLYANGTKIATKTLDASMNWSYTWTDLDKNADGKLIVYTVGEEAVAGYVTTIEGFVITNTYEPETANYSVVKVWDDHNNQDGKRPYAVVLTLYLNGEPTEHEVIVSEANGWRGTWTNMHVYRDGIVANYSVVETGYYVTERDLANGNRTRGVPEGYTVAHSYDRVNHIATITNHYDPEHTFVNVEKRWEDANNQDGIRPESIVVILYKTVGGVKSEYGRLTLDASNEWDGDFLQLPRYENGQWVSYTIEEVVPNGYTAQYKFDNELHIVTITNIHVPETVDVAVNKVWNDADNQDGLRPNSIQVELYANGAATGQKLILNAANNWKGAFADLPRYSGGVAVVYTIAEIAAPAGYTVAITGNAADGFTVTNAHAVAKTSITVNKVWNDANNQDGLRPASITVYLYANGVKIASQTLSASENWSYTWQNLNEFADGKQIVYTVGEEAVAGYVTTIEGFVITNTHTAEKTGISASKVWNDEDDQDGKRPSFVTVHLLANGEHTGLTQILSEENGWTASWTNLDKYVNGALVNYTVHEEAVEGYYTTYQRDSQNEHHVIITNTYSVEKTAFAVLKIWDDGHNQDGLRSDVVVELYANGKPTGITATLSEAGHWTYTFADLDKFDDGQVIVYTAVEKTALPGYTVTYRTDSHTGIYEIVNTRVPETVSVSVSKQWDDADNRDGLRPDRVMFVLIANGLTTDQYLILNAENNWNSAWTNLPKYENGQLITYTVQEILAVEGYVSIVESDPDNAYAFTVTNRYEAQKTGVTVNKLWVDQDNGKNSRPESIVVALLANGQVLAEVVLDESNGWSHTWTDLYKYADGQLIAYTVEEVTVDNYIVSYANGVDANGQTVWTITNTLIDTTPDTGDAIWNVVMAMLFSMAALVALVPGMRKERK